MLLVIGLNPPKKNPLPVSFRTRRQRALLRAVGKSQISNLKSQTRG